MQSLDKQLLQHIEGRQSDASSSVEEKENPLPVDQMKTKDIKDYDNIMENGKGTIRQAVAANYCKEKKFWKTIKMAQLYIGTISMWKLNFYSVVL